MKKILILLFTTAAAILGAKTLYFRSGEIIAAQLTSNKINIRNFDKNAFNSLPERPLFAILTINAVPGRKISILDYSLVVDGISYPCVATGSNNNFICSDAAQDGSKVRQLLFIVGCDYLRRINSFTLKCNLAPADGTYDIQVPFTNIGSQTPTLPENIPADGLLEINQ